MAEEYVLIPENRSLKAIKGIESVPFSFQLQKAVETGIIKEIKVNTNEAAWEISLIVHEGLDEADRIELEQAVAELIPRVKISFKLITQAVLPPFSERVVAAWETFVKSATEKFVGMNGWLLEAKYVISGEGNLEVQVRNQAGVDYLNSHREELAELLRELLFQAVHLQFVIGDFEEQIVRDELLKAEQEREDLENLLKSVEASTAKPVAVKAGQKTTSTAPGVIHGKKITGPVCPLKEIQEEANAVVVYGQIFRYESRVSRAGKKFYLGDITDYTDSINFKIFPRKENPLLDEGISEGSWVKIQGDVQLDAFSRELGLMVSDINLAEVIEREDNAPEKRIELHLHTKMSAMDATVDAAEAVKQAAKWGHPAIAVTDHGVVHSFPEVASVAKKAGIKVIYGMEGYLVDDEAPIVIGANDQRLDEVEYVVFDLETTGFNPWKEDLLEVGAVRYKNGVKIGEYNNLVRPGKEISVTIQNLTGITPEMVADAPLPEQVVREFLDFAAGAVLVAHNARFDVGFISAKIQQLFGEKFAPIYLDTLGLARSVWPHLRSYRLNVVAKELGIKLENHHRAVDDGECAAQILLRALEVIAPRRFELLNEINSLIGESSVEKLRTNHIIILAKSKIGMNHLYRLVSESHINYFYRQPRIPRTLLEKYREGLIIGSACEAGELYQAILDGADENKLKEIASFYDYLEIQPLGNNQFLIDSGRVKSTVELQEYNKMIINLAEQLGKPVVGTGDVHFLRPRDSIYRQILMQGQGFEDADKQAPLYFRTTEEMLAEFAYLGPELAREVVIVNPAKILKQVEDVNPLPDEFCPPEIPGAEEEIRQMSYDRAREWYGDPLPQLVEERLEWELKSIIDHGYAVLYLTAQKLVKKSLDDGYLVGSRGSVGSSFVATMCQITEVNPLPAHYRCSNCKYSEFKETGAIASGYDLPDQDCPHCGQALIKDGQDIPFATFMGFEGDKEPDIDLNFSGEYQPVIHRYTEEVFGKGYVFRAGTVTGLADKTAFGFVKGFMDDKGIKLRQAEISRLVKGCTGVRRSTGQHPGGLYVVPHNQEIYNFTPIQYPANDKKAEWITTHFEYHGALEGRLVKLDILGHDDPTVIRMLHDLTGIDPRTVTMAEPNTMKLFSSLEPLGLTEEQLGTKLGTLGIPEFGTGFVRQMLEETKPTTFGELVFISGLSHGTDVWLGNAQELIKNKTATLSEVISTRDDIMNYLIFKGLPSKTAFKIMEKVRKGRGLDESEIQIMKEHEVPQWYIDSCLKIKYMFPKAHAVAYVMMAFRIAYFKVNYPEAYYAAFFTIRADEFDAEYVVHGEQEVRNYLEQIRQKGNDATQKEKNVEVILEIVLEAMLRGVKFLHVDLYKSDPVNFIITPDGLLPPLGSLAGLGKNAAKAMALAREAGEFRSIEDLKNRARLSSAVIEVLQKHGCLTGMTETDQLTLF